MHPPGNEPEPEDPKSNALTDCTIETPYVTQAQKSRSCILSVTQIKKEAELKPQLGALRPE